MLINQHDGWVELSDVEGMLAKDGSGKSINDAGRVKIKTCTKKVCALKFLPSFELILVYLSTDTKESRPAVLGVKLRKI